ncbi:hypothetical protein EJ06DRAFT_518359 [Trichodelitschia bisporula]|uniref:Mid2 domain-containing protein n=1 Tax=Trichodelitschia bisporula TaxID=703511 RepID=A0A6G1IAN7_9PEZI|nr:hypothetical protein EJ06DRAFT_518359 [Trichodelitschia bisporula]
MLIIPLLLALLFALSTAASSRCWAPDGKTVPALDVPCNNDGNSTCCGQGWACLSNNICMWTPSVQDKVTNHYGRGSCTDPTWTDPNCPKFCVSLSAGDNIPGAEAMARCPHVDNTFYCLNDNQANVNCERQDGVLTFPGTFSIVTVIGASTMSPSSNTNTSDPTSFRVSPNPTTTLSSPSAASTSTPDPKIEVLRSRTIGLAVGIPLGFLALAGAAYLFYRERRLRSIRSSASLGNATDPMRTSTPAAPVPYNPHRYGDGPGPAPMWGPGVPHSESGLSVAPQYSQAEVLRELPAEKTEPSEMG